jgi:GxxExxY protein
MEPNEVARTVVDAAIKVHTSLGPGLLESVYEACLAHELGQRGHRVERQLSLPVHYDGMTVEAGLRLDLLVEQRLVVELKAVEVLLPIHTAQLLTYLKLGNYPLGLLLNFNVAHMKDGIKRLANGMKE